MTRRVTQREIEHTSEGGVALRPTTGLALRPGGVLVWNSFEKFCPCPCHGSRYHAGDGHVVNGPAISGPAEAKAED